MELSSGHCVLLLWGAGQSPDQLQGYVETLKSQVGETGKIQVENLDRLVMCKHRSKLFQVKK